MILGEKYEISSLKSIINSLKIITRLPKILFSFIYEYKTTKKNYSKSNH